jgi:hypothetical protein
VFQQLLDPALYEVEVVSHEMLAAEGLSVVEAQTIGLLCIGAAPLGGRTSST